MATTIRWQDFLVPGLAGLEGALLGRSQTGSNTGTSSGTSTNRNTSNPIIPSDVMPLRSELIARHLGLLKEPIDLSGVKASAIDDINKASDIRSRSAEEMLAARGISGPAAANVIQNIQDTRYADIMKYKQNFPLLQEQINSSRLNAASSFLNSIPTGTDNTSSGTNFSTTSGTNTTPGNALGQGVSNAAGIVTDMLMRGDFGNILGKIGGAGAGAVMGEMHGVPIAMGGGGAAGGSSIFGSVGSALGAIPVAGQIALGVGGAALLAKKVFGWGNTHEKADTWVKGTQNDFDETMSGYTKQFESGQISEEQLKSLRNFTVDAYKKAMDKFSEQGKDQKKVIKQAKNTFNKYYGPLGYFA